MSDFHYFASSAMNWKTGTDLQKMLKQLKRIDKHCGGCNVFIVPLPPEATYSINYYRPVVEGVKYCGFYSYDAGFNFTHLLKEHS